MRAKNLHLQYMNIRSAGQKPRCGGCRWVTMKRPPAQIIRCIMSSTIQNQTTLSKFGALVFVRQTPQLAAERHSSLLNSLRDRRERRTAATELNALSDRNLADIGVMRANIPAIIRGQF
jgi:uncharacterized protein YjiS (DUF1127 family)